MAENAHHYLAKLVDALLSRRFQVFAGAVGLLLFREQLGLDTPTVQLIQQAAIAWIIGDSLRPTTRGL